MPAEPPFVVLMHSGYDRGGGNGFKNPNIKIRLKELKFMLKTVKLRLFFCYVD
jgi:hypothetical protein